MSYLLRTRWDLEVHPSKELPGTALAQSRLEKRLRRMEGAVQPHRGHPVQPETPAQGVLRSFLIPSPSYRRGEQAADTPAHSQQASWPKCPGRRWDSSLHTWSSMHVPLFPSRGHLESDWEGEERARQGCSTAASLPICPQAPQGREPHQTWKPEIPTGASVLGPSHMCTHATKEEGAADQTRN